MRSTPELYKDYCDRLKKMADIKYASAVLQWDQETYLPSKGAAARSRQLATLNEISHQLSTDESLTQLLLELTERKELSSKERKNIELTLQEVQRQQKFTSAFVRNMSETVSAAFYSWIQARKQNDFSIYEPALTRLVDLKRQEAKIIGYKDHPYDALLDEFEKGATVKMLDDAFDKVLSPLKKLMVEVTARQQEERDFLHQHFPEKQQWEWGMYLVKQLGFDLEAGRQDISEHPFTTNFSAKDVRITTRIDENDFANMTWSCIHETGHALYEQGLPDEEYGLPSGEYASLSIHESQSRLWENCVGRSKPFWQFYLPVLKQYFPGQLNEVSVDNFTGAINRVESSFIRTEADELTYHFHVFIRFTLEKEVIAGNVTVKDIPAYWNELYAKYLHVKVPDAKRGCLQDVHWSHGSFGYFPTYSLGSFYAAQFWQQCKLEIPSIEEQISKGDSSALLNWLRENIHIHGKTYTSQELCEKVTGKVLDSNIFFEYLRNKLLNTNAL
jgi:carboxypeptidase Taq